MISKDCHCLRGAPNSGLSFLSVTTILGKNILDNSVQF
jgi:hypothetical protein